jgi:hypothetical protein
MRTFLKEVIISSTSTTATTRSTIRCTFSDNKMEFGFMKNETGGKEISDACAIRAKMFAFRMSDGQRKRRQRVSEDMS